MTKLADGLLALGAAVALSCAPDGSNAQDKEPPRRAVPIDPVTAVIEALSTHQIVALGDWHHNVQLHEFRLTLLRDSRFPDVVRDIVVEFATPDQQAMIDSYVNGRDVPTGTSQGGIWAWPDNAEFYRAVRDVNANLAENRRIRVVAGQVGPAMKEEAAFIEHEVIDKGRKALIVYGGGHFTRKPLFWPVSDRKFAEMMYTHPDSVSTVAHLEAAGVSVFSVYAQPSDAFVAVQPGG